VGYARAVALAGFVVVAGSFGAILSPAFRMPASDDPSVQFARHFADERTALLVLAWSNAIGMTIVLGVLVALSGLLRERSPLLAATGLAAGLVTIVFTVCGFAVLAAVAYTTPEAEPARDGAALAWMFINVSAGPPTTLSIGAYTVALARSEHATAWLTPLGVLVAAAHLVVAGALMDDGPLSPHGTVAYVVPCLYFVWIGAACLVLWRAPAQATSRGS